MSTAPWKRRIKLSRRYLWLSTEADWCHKENIKWNKSLYGGRHIIFFIWRSQHKFIWRLSYKIIWRHHTIILCGGRNIILYDGRHMSNLCGGRQITLYGGRHIKTYFNVCFACGTNRTCKKHMWLHILVDFVFTILNRSWKNLASPLITEAVV